MLLTTIAEYQQSVQSVTACLQTKLLGDLRRGATHRGTGWRWSGTRGNDFTNDNQH